MSNYPSTSGFPGFKGCYVEPQVFSEVVSGRVLWIELLSSGGSKALTVASCPFYEGTLAPTPPLEKEYMVQR